MCDTQFFRMTVLSINDKRMYSGNDKIIKELRNEKQS